MAKLMIDGDPGAIRWLYEELTERHYLGSDFEVAVLDEHESALIENADRRIAELEAQRDSWKADALARFDRIEELEERLNNARWDFDEAMQQHDDQRRRACEAEARVKELEAELREPTVLHKKWHDRAYEVLEKYEVALARIEALEAVLRRVEWCYDNEITGDRECPVCWQNQKQGHASDCALDAALNKEARDA
jgi:DNA repair exonuclease SbcCD ATPase subunit